MSDLHNYPSARDAGPSSIPYAASTTASIAGGGSSSRRKPPKPAVSLGLEDEVEFGSDEDLMEVVGEIALPAPQAWYPGRPESPPPKEKPKKKGLGIGTNNAAGMKSRTGLFGKDKDKAKAKGLEDARLMSVEEMAGRPSTVDLHSGPSLPSLIGGGGRRNREASEHSWESSVKTANSALGLPGSRRQKVFGKFFGGGSGGKKGSKEHGSEVQSRMASNTRSILITSAHVPPNHTPSSHMSTDPSSSLSSFPRTPFSVDHDQGHGRRNGSASTSASAHKQSSSGGSAGVPMIRRPSTAPSVPSSSDSPESYGQASPCKPITTAVQTLTAESEAEMAISGSRNKSDERKNSSTSNGTNGHAAPPSSYTPVSAMPSVHPSVSTPTGASTHGPDTGGMTYDALLPNFPTAGIAIEGITILAATVFRRMPGSSCAAEQRLRPGTASSTTSTFSGPRRSVWQSHQLVLTAFRVHDSTPRPTPNPDGTGRRRQPSETRTVAHLHLFGQPQQKATSRPTSIGVGMARKPTTVVEGIPRIELERQEITAATTAGVWEHGDADAGSAVGRKWVLRVGFEGEPEEWLCDMPTGDTLFEWVRQIKAHATVVRAEGLGYGPVIRQAHMNGNDDLNLELELHEQGLKATPRATNTSLLPNASALSEDHNGAYGQPQVYQAGMLSPDRAVVPDSPYGVSMRDFMTRKSLSARGQDLATFLDHADMDWQIRQAEKNRSRQARSEAGSVVGDMATQGSVNRRMSVCAMTRPRTPSRDGDRRSPVKGGRTGVPPPPAGPPPACQLPAPPASTVIPPVPPLPPLLPAPIVALPATPSSSGGTPVTPAQPSAATMPAMPPLASPIRSTPGREHLTPEAISRSCFVGGDLPIVEGFSTTDSAAEASTRMRKLSTTDDTRLASAQGAVPATAPPSSYAGSVVDDGESITSGTSSQQRMKRRTQKQPAMDLMAELSSRPEMNYPKPGALSEDAKVVVDENRPRKIRFG